MLPILPSLEDNGFLNSPLAIMSKLWEYYQASDYSQSNLFMGDITSLKYTLQKTTSVDDLKEMIEDDITKLYGCYFLEVIPEVKLKLLNNNTINIIVDIKVNHDNEIFLLSRAIKGKASGVIEYETKLMEKYKYDNPEGKI